MMKTLNFLWSILGSAVIILGGCNEGRQRHVERTITPQTIEEWARENEVRWINDAARLIVSSRSPSEFPQAEILDFKSLLQLSDVELQRILDFTIIGTTINDPTIVDFSRFTSLVKLNVADTNLDTLRGLEHTRIQSLGLSGVPLKDISLISKLTGLKALGLGSTGAGDLSLDLSHLTDLETVNLVNPGLKSIEGILTIPNPFILSVIGDYYKLPIDIGALRAIVKSKAKGLYMHQENQEMYGEPLQEIVEEARKYVPGFFLAVPGT